MGLERVAINYEVLAPGERSSWPHAHSEAEEFIFILEGHPQIWINSEVYDLNPGDCVGLPPGTGYAHTLINNSNETVRSIVMGECHVPSDKIIYSHHPKRNEEMKERGHLWEDIPAQKMGSHDGWSDRKRPS